MDKSDLETLTKLFNTYGYAPVRSELDRLNFDMDSPVLLSDKDFKQVSHLNDRYGYGPVRGQLDYWYFNREQEKFQ